jgi:hypothetical protein
MAPGPGTITSSLGLEHDLAERFPILYQAMSLGRLLEGQLAIDHGAAQRARGHELDEVVELLW